MAKTTQGTIQPKSYDVPVKPESVLIPEKSTTMGGASMKPKMGKVHPARHAIRGTKGEY